METPLPDPTSPQIISLNVNPFNIETLGLMFYKGSLCFHVVVQQAFPLSPAVLHFFGCA